MRPPDLLWSARQYLRLRRALGFKLERAGLYLPQFIAFLKAHESSVITTELAVRWAQQAPGLPSSWAGRLSVIRSFARHHRALDLRTEIPPPDAIPVPGLRPRPYIYTDGEISALMRAARALAAPLQALTYETVIGLLSVTGMRVGEVVALDEGDVDWPRSLLMVRRAKFQKARFVPLHGTALAALRSYAAHRDHLFPRRPSMAFFVSSVGTRLLKPRFGRVFIRMVRESGVGRPGERRPRIHDMRHTFAVGTLRDWYRSGIDAEHRLPSLSTYLGHVNPSATYHYLSATPELLGLACRRLERAWEVKS
jgi:integrase/recombinase XerD